MLFSILGSSSLPVVVAQPDKTHVSVLEWYDRYGLVHVKQFLTTLSAACLVFIKLQLVMLIYVEDLGAGVVLQCLSINRVATAIEKN